MDGTVDVSPFVPPRPCALCHRIFSSGNEDIDLEAMNICGDCKFLFLEDNINVTLSPSPSPHDIERRTPRVRRTRYNSSESIENMFSQQFSSMINLARLYQRPVSEQDNQSMDSFHHTSTRTTPNGSRRWRRGLSDTESDGFDSFYGESDVFSYGGDSDASVDVHSFVDPGSDSDIDPMHAGLNQWSSDDDDDEGLENTIGSLIARVELHRETSHNVGNSGDYLDARSFEDLLDRLAEADGSRRGAPPAAVLFVNNLERVVVNKEEHDGVACAVCKEILTVGSVVNRLPCLHVYHSWCIKPWLSARNSCPLCRYEVPTDDKDYENRKQSSHGLRVQETDGSSEEDEIVNVDNGGRGRWLFPIMSVVGIGVALWLGNTGAVRSFSTQRGDRSRRWWSLF